MTRFFTTDDGLNIAFDETGQGLPLLCLPGLTRNMADFDFVVRDFADRARIIRMDLRGRGQSDYDPVYQNYNLVRESLDVLALLNHLGIDRVAILGTSRGGLIAMMLAPKHADRMLGVCLNDIGPVIEPAGVAMIRAYLGREPEFPDYDQAANALAAVTQAAFPGVPLEVWRLHAERIWKVTPKGLELRYDRRLREAFLEQMAESNPVPLWPEFDALGPLPLALIRGEHSDILSRETVQEMRRRRPDMIYSEVPDRGHVPFLDEPEAQDVISRFLERLT